MSKDWIGNNKSIYTCLGASNHSDNEREQDDYYATEPKALELLLELEKFNNNIWECAVGGGHLSKVLEDKGFNVFNSDIVDRGYPNTKVIDFLSIPKDKIRNDRDIITNPPYSKCFEFIKQAIELSEDGVKIAMFLKLTFAESKKRKWLFENYPPVRVWVSSSRLKCAMNGDFEKYNKSTTGTAVAYAWWIWEVGNYGTTEMRWFN